MESSVSTFSQSIYVSRKVVVGLQELFLNRLGALLWKMKAHYPSRALSKVALGTAPQCLLSTDIRSGSHGDRAFLTVTRLCPRT